MISLDILTRWHTAASSKLLSHEEGDVSFKTGPTQLLRALRNLGVDMNLVFRLCNTVQWIVGLNLESAHRNGAGLSISQLIRRHKLFKEGYWEVADESCRVRPKSLERNATRCRSEVTSWVRGNFITITHQTVTFSLSAISLPEPTPHWSPSSPTDLT